MSATGASGSGPSGSGNPGTGSATAANPLTELENLVQTMDTEETSEAKENERAKKMLAKIPRGNEAHAYFEMRERKYRELVAKNKELEQHLQDANDVVGQLTNIEAVANSNNPTQPNPTGSN